MLAPALLLAAACAAAPAENAKPVLTVLYFDNQTGSADYDVLRKGLADMIITDLVAWDGVAVVERDKLEAVIGELKLQHTRTFDQSTAAKVGKLLGAQYLLTGTLHSAAPQLRIDARLIQAEKGQVVASASVRGPQEKVFDLEQELVDRITAGIDLKVKNLAARRKVKVPDLDVLLAYSKAIDLSDQGKEKEAQKAIQAVVSRSPAFLMARERKEQILKRLEEAEKRRAEVVTGSALELGRLSEAALKDDSAFDKLDEKGQRQRLSMRVVRGRFLARLLKQHLSWRRESLRVVLKGKEVEALKVVRAWLANQRHLVDERGLQQRLNPHVSSRLELEPELINLLQDAKMGSLDLGDPFDDWVRFVVEGRVRDGEATYNLAPTPGDLEVEERKLVLDALDQRVQAALARVPQAEAAKRAEVERVATDLLLRKAEVLVLLGKEEEAIVEYQRVLDAFPTGKSNDRAERRIRLLIGAEHNHDRGCRERWAKALKDGCADDMDIRVGSGPVLQGRIRHQGLAALAAHALELEKACQITPRNRSAVASVYRDLALDAANHEDCEGFRSWFRKYVEADGSISDMMGYQKNWTPWCELGEVVRSVLWMHGKLDRDWSFEFDRQLTSVLSHDGKRLILNAGKESSPEALSLYLDATGPGTFACGLAQWRQRSNEHLEGTCHVTVTKLASQKGEFDEGTFDATFEIKEQGFARKKVLSEGNFRVRRQ
ncbi:MAG: hypothetical protein HY901_20505 [Deltaproteobacteria bacterium]|nr:hypothetical protein [Deltaproteobacteria bacterium]